MAFDMNLEALESAIMDAPPGEVAPLPDFSAPATAEAIAAPEIELMTEHSFLDQWFLLHDMGGGMIQMRTGAPCPLGDKARGEGGRAAGAAAYALLSSQPALAKLFLSTQSTFLGQLAAIGMHGFACVQVVKASATGATLPPPQEAEE